MSGQILSCEVNVRRLLLAGADSVHRLGRRSLAGAPFDAGAHLQSPRAVFFGGPVPGLPRLVQRQASARDSDGPDEHTMGRVQCGGGSGAGVESHAPHAGLLVQQASCQVREGERVRS